MSKRSHIISFWIWLVLGLGIILYYDWRLIILFGGIIFVLIAFYHLSIIKKLDIKFEREKLEKK